MEVDAGSALVGGGAESLEQQTGKNKRTALQWCKKYFWEGQVRSNNEALFKATPTIEDYSWYKVFNRNRRVLSLALPSLVFHIFWWSYVATYNLWNKFETKWFMSVTMAFGSVIAGMTSEGGGAVAFPVMTLAFNIEPFVARDFSIMIQSCGMSAATVAIFLMNIHLEWNVLFWSSIGGALGIIFGFHCVDPYVPAPYKKMAFVSIWFSFAFALFFLNRTHKRETFLLIPNLTWWKILVLILVGFVGGIFTSFSGSGLDICSFCTITLLFRVSEKIATPTSVVLMAFNSLVGFYWRAVMMNAIQQDSWDFLIVCIPIVVIGAPFGSVLGSHFHRLVLAAMIYIIDTVALISAFILVPQKPALLATSIGIIVFGFIFFFCLTKIGACILERQKQQDKDLCDKNPNP